MLEEVNSLNASEIMYTLMTIKNQDVEFQLDCQCPPRRYLLKDSRRCKLVMYNTSETKPLGK